MNEVMKIKMNLEAKVKIISTAKKDITEKTNSVILDLKKTKEEIVSRIDKMINEAEGQNRIENIHIDDEVLAMNSNIELLSSIQQNINADEDISYEGIMNHRDTVAGVSEHNTENLSGVRSFGYPVYLVDKSCADVTLGTLKTEEISITLIESEDVSLESIPKIPTITNVSQLKCSGIVFCLAKSCAPFRDSYNTIDFIAMFFNVHNPFLKIRSMFEYYFVSVTKTTNTGIDFLYGFTILHDEIGVICGDESGIVKIKSYNLQTARELNCLTSVDVEGLAEVQFDGKVTLAVSHL